MVADHSIILRHRWEFRMKQEDLENTMLVNLREADEALAADSFVIDRLQEAGEGCTPQPTPYLAN